mmetsp:Transcript_36283/g.36681  ORF Transcript_36283/g.36681 Transcript_36283/m.36681 type:complete len:118 (+) Transcript_36283:244-597(+)
MRTAPLWNSQMATTASNSYERTRMGLSASRTTPSTSPTSEEKILTESTRPCPRTSPTTQRNSCRPSERRTTMDTSPSTPLTSSIRATSRYITPNVDLLGLLHDDDWTGYDDVHQVMS